MPSSALCRFQSQQLLRKPPKTKSASLHNNVGLLFPPPASSIMRTHYIQTFLSLLPLFSFRSHRQKTYLQRRHVVRHNAKPYIPYQNRRCPRSFLYAKRRTMPCCTRTNKKGKTSKLPTRVGAAKTKIIKYYNASEVPRAPPQLKADSLDEVISLAARALPVSSTPEALKWISPPR